MSADNQITLVKFQKADGSVVFRVFESQLSVGEFSSLYAMSTQAPQRFYLELSGPDAFMCAMQLAERMDRALNPEYGVNFHGCFGDALPLTFADLQRRASEDGYETSGLIEMTDEAYAKLPNCWLLDNVS